MMPKTKLLFFIGALLAGCSPVENSSTLDRTRYGPSPDFSNATPLFAAVRTSLLKCQDCHGIWQSYSENDFKTTGLIVGGSPDSSKLYYRNQTAATGPGIRNMPTGGYSPLGPEEIENMINWINAL